MKIGVAQTRPVTGDIESNVECHATLTDMAVSNGAEVVVFPELSITGYEPTLANDLAMSCRDHRLDRLQCISDANHVMIGVGVPTRTAEGVCISLVLIQPRRDRQVYSKMHLHSDEEPFFVRGPVSTGLFGDEEKIALAICYELTVPDHAANASQNGASVYLASVAKPAEDVERAIKRLGAIAREYSMMVLMCNCVGLCDGWESGGKSSVWNNQGVLLGQLDDSTEGIIILDTETERVVQRQHFP